MKKPRLIVVTGRPASGKTTLAHLLAKEIRCPLLSRDEFKEGYINTVRPDRDSLPDAIGKNIYEVFFQAVDLLVSNHISIIIEAAFQHILWQPKLSNFFDNADVRIIICETDIETALKRFLKRASDDAGREKFHGDESTGLGELLIQSYEAPQLPVPTLYVDTMKDYVPDLSRIIRFATAESTR